MRRADRLFQLVQILRNKRLVTARELAERLEVSERTIYRDIQDLSLSGVPVEGEAGVGYHLRYSLDIPPLMFSAAEIEALVVGARMLKAWGGSELGRSAQSVLDNWLKSLMGGGIDWILADCQKSGRGRKPKLTKPQQMELKQRVLDGPEANGFDSGVWNTAMINELCLRQFGVGFNPRYLAALLKKLGLSYQKAGFISDRVDEEAYEALRKQWVNETWPAILAQAKASNAIILFGDEVSFAMWGSLSRTWAARGEQPLVKTKGIRKGLKMYGVIEFAGGGFHYMESLHYTLKSKSLRELKSAGLPSHLHTLLKPLKDEAFKTRDSFIQRLEDILGKENTPLHQVLIMKHTETAGHFNQEGYIAFLKGVMEHFKGSNIILIEDGAPYHKAGKVSDFVTGTQGQLVMERLPAFSPDLNPIEKLWRNTKNAATHLKYFATFEALRESVTKAFQQYLQDASKILCVMKKLRQQATSGFIPQDNPVTA